MAAHSFMNMRNLVTLFAVAVHSSSPSVLTIALKKRRAAFALSAACSHGLGFKRYRNHGFIDVQFCVTCALVVINNLY